MSNPCQQCGRPATYRHPIQAKDGRVKVQQRAKFRCSRKDHDLCDRCWRKLMDAHRAQEAA